MSDDIRDRAKSIEHHRNYCRHYNPRGGGVKIKCDAGCDIDQIKRVSIPGGTMRWAPCIEGHLLPNALEICPKWDRRTQEEGEAYADSVERSLRKLTIVGPFISAWRKKPWGKREVVECPVCKGRLHLEQSGYNGHVRACCETKDCINFIE